MADDNSRRREFDALLLKTSVDDEARRAADHVGAPLVCFGVILQDEVGQLCWYNRAHPSFVEAVNSSAQTELIAVMGTTEEGKIYFHASHGHGGSTAGVRSLGSALVVGGPPTKDTLLIARLSRSEIAKRMAAGLVPDQKLVAEVRKVPDYVQMFFCRVARQCYSVSWDEPNPAPFMN